MNQCYARIALLAATAALGAIVGFIAGRLSKRIERKPSLRSRPASSPGLQPDAHPADHTESEATDAFPASVTPDVIVGSVSHCDALSDAEIDALPPELPVRNRPRSRTAPPPRTRTLDRL